jgi:hypothetical protein
MIGIKESWTMKHVGPLKPHRPAPGYWRDLAFTFAGAGAWMTLNSLRTVGLGDQLIILAIVVVVLPSAVAVGRIFAQWWSASRIPMTSFENGVPLGVDALWPMGTVWVGDPLPKSPMPNPWPASPLSIPPDVRRRLRKDVG